MNKQKVVDRLQYEDQWDVVLIMRILINLF